MIATPGQDCFNNASLKALKPEKACVKSEADIIYSRQHSSSDKKSGQNFWSKDSSPNNADKDKWLELSGKNGLFAERALGKWTLQL